ncbi:TMEM43 family protein [Rhizobium sp. S96]|uniref:TMEM43 family protein n=1 Tax=Rhizobium sp. S96 TaxID=3055140 RepID=UPI0025AB1F15|nr:TMEM43 family protein [Rhizobium sp. S96]MDM9622630.1 TMEM43 family protein [Rhizobium sp. S96]
MSVTETTPTSWFGRLKNALIGSLVGIVLLVACAWLLIWNEGRAIDTYRALAEGAAQVESISSEAVDPANDGKLVHISGPVKPHGSPRDSELGVSANDAVALSRQVEMYQWVEKSESKSEKKLGGGEETTTTYSYSKEWRSDVVQSGDFKQAEGHQNPESMPANSTFAVERASVGAFSVSGQTIADIGSYSDLTLTDDDLAHVTQALASDKPLKRTARGLYVGQSASSPEVGDLRLSYQRVDAREASVVGKQSKDTLVPYETTNHRDILLSAAGDTDAAQMFKSAEAENAFITWLVRAGGLVGLFVGFVCIFSILSVIGDVVPFIGSIVAFGTTLLAFVLTLVVGPLLIAIGWLAYRPVLSISIIAGGVALAMLVLRYRKGNAAQSSA